MAQNKESGMERFERQFSESHADPYFKLERCEDIEFESAFGDFYEFTHRVIDRKTGRIACYVVYFDATKWLYDAFITDDEDEKEHWAERICGKHFWPTRNREDAIMIRGIQEKYMIDDLTYLIWDLLNGELGDADGEYYNQWNHHDDVIYWKGPFDGMFCIGYLNDVYRATREQPFPYPKFPDNELLSSWDTLKHFNSTDPSINSRAGDKLISHFHESIYHDHLDGEMSPYEAWQDDDLVWEVIQNRVIFQRHLTLGKVLTGLNITKKAPKVSVFSAARAKAIANKYLSQYDVIFDPFSGFSGRMLGVTADGKKYIGHDMSMTHINESNAMAKWLKSYGANMEVELDVADCIKTTGSYPCLFTCSPYGTKEQWLDVPVSAATCDDWIDVCLKNYKCKRYVFVVDNEIEKYKPYAADIIGNKSHFGKNFEYIVVIDRDGDDIKPIKESVVK